MVKKTALFLGMLLYCSSVWAEGDSTSSPVTPVEKEPLLEKVGETVKRAMSKAGIQFGGEFRSQFLLSRVDGDTGAVSPDKRTGESVEMTSVDFDICARPNSAIQGRVVFRLHQDWRNFFSDIQNPIFLRWVSMDGLVKDMYGYNVGDYKERYSNLTLHSPDVSIDFEPDIFALRRRVAMKEAFLEDDQRILQGVNFNFDAEISPLLKEMHFNAMGSRLRLAEVSIKNGSLVANKLEIAPMDKYLVASNLDLLVMPGLSAGGSILYIFDSKPSSDLKKLPTETEAQRTLVWALRGGLGTDLFVSTDAFSVGVDVELASATSDSGWAIIDTTTDASGSTYDTTYKYTDISGKAVAADLAASGKIGDIGCFDVSIGVIKNDADFLNELAQSPTFFPERIMNVENDIDELGTLYSTFDALYRHVFKFAPSKSTNRWVMAPMSKLAYENSILSSKELAGIPLDPAIQLVMPQGPATPNRIGPRGSAGVDLFDGGVSVSGKGMVVNEINGTENVETGAGDTVDLPVTKFLEAGGGACVDFAAFIKALPHPLKLSVGYTMSQASNAGESGKATSSFGTKVGFLNAGLTWKFWKRASLLAGLQRIARTYEPLALIDDNTVDEIQMQWAAGLLYEVSEGGALTGTFGMTDVSRTGADINGAKAPNGDFSQWQIDLFLTVTF